MPVPAVPTNFTPEIVTKAVRLFEEIFRPGYRYKKAGVLMLELVPEGVKVTDLGSLNGTFYAGHRVTEMVLAVSSDKSAKGFFPALPRGEAAFARTRRAASLHGLAITPEGLLVPPAPAVAAFPWKRPSVNIVRRSRQKMKLILSS